jgi:xanthine dehydrogenase accessory factor
MDSLQLLETALRLRREQQPFAWVTVLHAQAPTSARPGDKALVLADGTLHGWVGGGCAQPAVVKTARLALADGRPRNIRITPAQEGSERDLNDVLEFGMACHSGGTLELFIDPLLPAKRLVVLGDSPVARSLVSLAPRVGLDVAVVAQGAQSSDFADASLVLGTDDSAEVNAALGTSPWVVVATQGRRDLPALRAALALHPQSLWFVSSTRKAEVLRQSLIAAGEDAQSVQAIIAPAGRMAGACTPEEIALSVLAEVVAARRMGGTPATPAQARPAPATAAAKSCCGGAAKAAPEPVSTPVVSSCCGG